jgi:hypothetical protein
MADENANDVKDIAPVSPTGKPVVPQWAVITLTVAVLVLPAVALIPGPQQPVIAVIAGVVASIGAAFGIVSPGLRSQAPQK